MVKIEENRAAKEKTNGCHKNTKQDSEQKVAKKANNKVEEAPKTKGKRGKKGRKTRAHQGCPKRRKGKVKEINNGAAMKKR